MKRIAVITMGVKLDNEKGYTRFRFLAEFLASNGYNVDLITTSFQHWEKQQRDMNTINFNDYPFGIRFIEEPGYKKNIDFRRIYSHGVAARNLKKMLEQDGQYDLIYCEIPPNDVALSAAQFAHEHAIPFVVDVNDLWPEAMKMVIDVPVLSNLLFSKFRRDAEEVYRLCSGVIGTSDEYRDRPFKRQSKDVLKETVYVGNELRIFDQGIQDYKGSIEKGEKEYWVTYAGTIGTSYDIKTMIIAADILKRKGYDDIHFKILGGGPLKEDMEKLAFTLEGSIEFVGYVAYERMAAYLSKSDILINSFVKKAPQSIVTKIGDYLAAGKPMINTCSSEEFKEKVRQDGFGINIEAENASTLAEAILSIYADKEWAEQMGVKARQIAEEQFDRPNSYIKILKMIDKLTGQIN